MIWSDAFVGYSPVCLFVPGRKLSGINVLQSAFGCTFNKEVGTFPRWEYFNCALASEGAGQHLLY